MRHSGENIIIFDDRAKKKGQLMMNRISKNL